MDKQPLTCDNAGQVAELEKVAALHQGARLLLRLRADDPGARCQLGNKYGAAPAAARDLLQVCVCCSCFCLCVGSKSLCSFC